MRRFHTCVCSTAHLPVDERRLIERLIADSRAGRSIIDHTDLTIVPHHDGYMIHVGVVEDHADRPADVPSARWQLLNFALDEGATWLSFDREELPSRGLPVYPDEDGPTAISGGLSPITIRCGTCGGANVMRDAWARWDDAAQDWVLGSVFDAAYCEDCEADVTLVERALLDACTLEDAA